MKVISRLRWTYCPSEMAFRSIQLIFSSVRGLNALPVLLLLISEGGRWPPDHGWDEDDMSTPLTDASILLGHLQTFHWSEMRDRQEVLQQRDNKHSKRNQMSIETVSVEQTMGNTMKLKWKGGMGWGNGFEVRWVRCGLGGFPPVVVTPFGLVGVVSNHQEKLRRRRRWIALLV